MRKKEYFATLDMELKTLGHVMMASKDMVELRLYPEVIPSLIKGLIGAYEDLSDRGVIGMTKMNLKIRLEPVDEGRCLGCGEVHD